MDDDPVTAHLTQLCRLINNTLATKSAEFLPRHGGLLFPTINLELNCQQLVEFVLPKVVLLLSLAVLLLVYYLYYRLCVVSVPRVVCADERRLRALKKHCPAFFEEYWPTIWAPQAHMQTVIRVAIQTFPKSKRKRCENE